MRFVKMHGIGNDYLYLDAVTDVAIEHRPDLPDLARAMSDRHRGVGSDGIILVCRPRGDAHVRMRMFNADGSESEMCGNGVRCVAKFAHDRLRVRDNPMRVETGRGVLAIGYETESGRLASATVDMGEPILDLPKIPVREDRVSPAPRGHEFRIEVGAKKEAWTAAFVSMGNPHAVFFDDENPGIRLDGPDRLDLPRIGPLIERHPAFPNRVNAHFVAVRSPREADMRTWERGAGATLACGTGACAVCVAGVRTGRLERDVLLHLPGGDLRIRWDEGSHHVLMTGPAEDVCEGEWPDRGVPLDPIPMIRTPRLVLRQLVPADAPAVADLCASRDVAANTLTIPYPYTLTDAHAWIARQETERRAGRSVNYAITLADSGVLVGTIGLRFERDHDRAELGYVVAELHRGRGYASEAARALVRHGFDALGLERIYAVHFARNPASGRVLVNAGMTFEGVARRLVKKWGTYEDSRIYAAVRGDPLPPV